MDILNRRRLVDLSHPIRSVIPSLDGAVLEALDGLPAGAAVDVVACEPIAPDNPLLTMENIVATPHVAARTRDTVYRERTWAAEDVRRVLQGEEPIHC